MGPGTRMGKIRSHKHRSGQLKCIDIAIVKFNMLNTNTLYNNNNNNNNKRTKSPEYNKYLGIVVFYPEVQREWVDVRTLSLLKQLNLNVL